MILSELYPKPRTCKFVAIPKIDTVTVALRKYSGQDKDNTINYFMKIKDKVDLEELRFY